MDEYPELDVSVDELKEAAENWNKSNARASKYFEKMFGFLLMGAVGIASPFIILKIIKDTSMPQARILSIAVACLLMLFGVIGWIMFFKMMRDRKKMEKDTKIPDSKALRTLNLIMSRLAAYDLGETWENVRENIYREDPSPFAKSLVSDTGFTEDGKKKKLFNFDSYYGTGVVQDPIKWKAVFLDRVAVLDYWLGKSALKKIWVLTRDEFNIEVTGKTLMAYGKALKINVTLSDLKMKGIIPEYSLKEYEKWKNNPPEETFTTDKGVDDDDEIIAPDWE